jgi:hypothetical protein
MEQRAYTLAGSRYSGDPFTMVRRTYVRTFTSRLILLTVLVGFAVALVAETNDPFVGK